MADYLAYHNGNWVPFSQVKIDPLDRGFRVGDVVFDVARTFNGKSFRMKEHIDRLYRSLKFVRIDPGPSAEEMLDIREEVIRRNEHLRPEVGDFSVTQFVTRGPGRWSWSAGPPTVCVKVEAIDFGRYARLFSDGAHAVITQDSKLSPRRSGPQDKALQPDELQPRRAGSGRRGPRSLANPHRRRW